MFLVAMDIDDCYVLVTYLVTATFQLFYVAEIIPRQAQVGVRRQNDRFVRSRSNHHQAAVPMATGEASKDKRKPSRHHPLSIHTYVPIYAPQISLRTSRDTTTSPKNQSSKSSRPAKYWRQCSKSLKRSLQINPRRGAGLCNLLYDETTYSYSGSVYYCISEGCSVEEKTWPRRECLAMNELISMGRVLSPAMISRA